MNPYKSFRSPGTEPSKFNTLSKRFDEPTYLSFKLMFGMGLDEQYNAAGLGTNINYDTMPHPLFMYEGNPDLDNRATYSSIDYLYDANEYTRAQMLKEFINKFNELQTDYPWYFKKIEGLDEMLKISTKGGIQVRPDSRITITCMEGLDLRMSHLLNLYKKIAWDDTYQRWVLPDMMRYFTLKIYISELRTFHTPNEYDGKGSGPWTSTTANPTPPKPGKGILNKIGDRLGISDLFGKSDPTGEVELVLKKLDNTLPTWVINCEMCEIDLETISFDYLSNLNIDGAAEEAGVKFSVKVGKIYEEQVYPVFQNMYLIDKALNGADRRKSKEGESNFDSTNHWQNNNFTKYALNVLELAQNSIDQSYQHISGTPFNEHTNETGMYGAQGAGPDGIFGTDDDKYNPIADQPETWVDNALDWGTSFVKGAVDKVVDKALMTPIPALGFSANELISVIESKNIISAIGLIKKSVNENNREEGPSINDPKGLSREYSSTESGRNSILNKPSDFSKATDLTGKGEKNIANPKIPTNSIRSKDYSKATGLIDGNLGVGEVNTPQRITGVYNSQNRQEGSILNKARDYSKATNLIGKGEINSIQKLDESGNFNINNDYSKATNMIGYEETNIPQELDITTTFIDQPNKKQDIINTLQNSENVKDMLDVNGNQIIEDDYSKATNLEGYKETNILQSLQPNGLINPKDYSKATNISGLDEININTSINKQINNLVDIESAATNNNGQPKTITLNKIFTALPTSMATEGGTINI